MQQEQIKKASKESLEAFDAISASAKNNLATVNASGHDALASVNTFTDVSTIGQLDAISRSNRIGYEALAREPAISRITVVDESGKEETVYISRGTSVSLSAGRKLASYRSPYGRLASANIGDEVPIRIQEQNRVLELREKVRYRPYQTSEVWDSRDSVFEAEDGVVTVKSLLTFLRDAVSVDDAEAMLEAILAGEGKASIQTGIRHEVRTAMALRDQPILDKVQDEIFRLPLNSQLLILGPPGTGKTTTLIRRLGQKIDPDYLEPSEKAIVEKIRAEERPRDRDWVMFTPTDLLKQYLKEAFNREQVPASDHQIKTWVKYRNDLARNILGILQSSNNAGKFILRDNACHVAEDVIRSPLKWVDDFDAFHRSRVLNQLQVGLRILQPLMNETNENLIRQLEDIVDGVEADSILATIHKLERIEEQISPLLKAMKDESDEMIRKELRFTFSANRNFLSELASFLGQLQIEEEIDTDDEFDDDTTDEVATQSTTEQKAARVYTQTIRNLARFKFLKRSARKGSKARSVSDWLGDRVPGEDVLLRIGESITVQNGLRRFVSASRRYVSDVPASYREYRKTSAKNEIWYRHLPNSPKHVEPMELDAVVLLMLRNARGLLSDPRVAGRINQQRFGYLKMITDRFYNQVLVDEATDFSPVQLACMGSLTHPATNSFFACGDFNQRITAWGTRSVDQIEWINGRLDTRSISIVYRQSKKLNEFSVELLRILGGDLDSKGKLPESSTHEGLLPALIENCSDNDDVATWLMERIQEVERSVGSGNMPSIAVLVASESAVGPMVESLNILLEDINLTAVACKDGQTLGEETNVRVFDAQHIKGLEFEAVFFVGVDVLEQNLGELFGKYLYVGATRAATYFGVICNERLPSVLDPLRGHFCKVWS